MSLKRIEAADQARASLQASLSSVALSFTLYDNATGDVYANFPGAAKLFITTIENEQILCYGRAGQVVTVYVENTHSLGILSAGEDGRGFAGTSAASHDADIVAYLNITKTIIEYIQDGIEDAETALAARYTKTETDALLASKNTKDPCEAATTANIALSGAQTIDGISIVADDRVLVKDQTTASQNGIYVCATGAWSRATDMDASAEFNAALVPVKKGTSNADTLWIQTADDPTVGTTAISFSNLTAALEKASDAEAAAGVNDTKYTTVDKVVHLLGNLVNTVHTYFVNTRAAKTTPVDADSVMICDSADSSKDKKMTVANLRKGLRDFGIVAQVESLSQNTTHYVDTVVTTGIRPVFIEINYKITGYGSAVWRRAIGTRVFEGTTLKYDFSLCNNLNTITSISPDEISNPNDVTPAIAGESDNDEEVLTSFAIQAVSDTGFTIRTTFTKNGSGVVSANGYANYSFKVS